MHKSRRDFLRSGSLLLAGAGVFGYEASRAAARNSTTEKGKAGMIQHNVYFWLKAGVTDAEKKQFEAGLRELVGSIKEVKKAELGRPAATAQREVIDHTWHYAIFSWFKSIADHDVYQEHPVHKKFIEQYSRLWERVRVYDSELFS